MGNLKNEHIPDEKTRAEISALLAFGITQIDTAAYMGMDVKTLRKHYRKELDTALTSANFKIANALYKNAVDNENVSAQIFWLKTKGGWKEPKDDVEQESSKPITINIVNPHNADQSD